MKAHRVDGDSLVLELRTGGEIVVRRVDRLAIRARRSAVSRAGSRGAGGPGAGPTAAAGVPYSEIIDRVVGRAERAGQAGARRDPGRVGLQRARPVAEGRDGPDAADAGDGAAVRGRRSLRSGRRTSRRASSTSSRCCSACRSRWRWRRITPAKRRCSGSAAFRRIPRRGTTSSRILAAREPVAKPRNRTQLFAGLHGLSIQGDRAEVDTITQIHARRVGYVEFRCRLASPNGEIVEGVYIADNEARLRHELEEKGLFVLSLQPKGAIARRLAAAAAAQAASTRASFWSSTRSWRRCSRPACRWSSRSTC